MKQCPSCGAENGPTTVKCQGCGETFKFAPPRVRRLENRIKRKRAARTELMEGNGDNWET